MSWAMCAVDTTIIATLAGLTGGAGSAFAPVLLLVLIAIAIRSNLRRGVVALSWTAPLLAVLVLAVPEPARPAGDRVRDALWWTGHLTAATVLAGVLSDRLDLAQRRRTQAESEAEAEHRRLEMERVLRRRLEDLDDARREFLTALLHEFRPSVSSLSCLRRALRRDEHDLDPEERAGMLERMDGSAHHLDAMLREVAEVLVSDSLDSRHRADLADVYLPHPVGTAATMAGLPPDRLVTRCEPGLSLVRADSGPCLRVLVKVLKEAARTSPAPEAVEVAVSRDGEQAEITVLDRRPAPVDGHVPANPIPDHRSALRCGSPPGWPREWGARWWPSPGWKAGWPSGFGSRSSPPPSPPRTADDEGSVVITSLRQRIEDPDRVVAEQIVSWVRLSIVTSMFIIVAVSGPRLRQYPDQLWWVFVAGFAYTVFAIVKTTRDARRRVQGAAWMGWTLSVLSAAFTVAFVACTGGARSPLLPVAFTVIISTAIRFNLFRSVAVAAAMGVAMAAVILWVPRPDIAWGERVQNAAYFAWLLVAVAVFVGIFSQAADRTRRARARAEAEAEAEHRRLDQEQRLRRRLEAVDQARKDFLLAVAHDFRMPIGSLESLSTALVRQRHDLDADQAEMLERIERHARTLAGMLEEVWEVAVTEALDAPRRVEIADVFIPDLVSSAADAAGVPPERLISTVDPTLLVLRTDGGKFERVMANLLEHAAEPEGAGHPLELRLAPVDGAIELSVTISGRPAAHPPEKGSGLGMWIVAQTVAALGGSLHVDPQPGGVQVLRASFPELSAVALPPMGSEPVY